MNNNYGFGFEPHFGLFGGFFFIVIAIVLVWTFFWKGKALWVAARNGQLIWFIVLLFVNTLGILEIIYLYFFAKECKECKEVHSAHHSHSVHHKNTEHEHEKQA